MLPKEKLERISELGRKAKGEGLTEAEKKEQKILRSEYLKAFRGNFKSHLENIKVVDPKGNDVTPDKLKKEKEKNRRYH